MLHAIAVAFSFLQVVAAAVKFLFVALHVKVLHLNSTASTGLLHPSAAFSAHHMLRLLGNVTVTL